MIRDPHADPAASVSEPGAAGIGLAYAQNAADHPHRTTPVSGFPSRAMTKAIRDAGRHQTRRRARRVAPCRSSQFGGLGQPGSAYHFRWQRPDHADMRTALADVSRAPPRARRVRTDRRMRLCSVQEASE